MSHYVQIVLQVAVRAPHAVRETHVHKRVAAACGIFPPVEARAPPRSVADVAIACSSEQHAQVEGLAVAAILVYPVGLIILNGLLLQWARGAIISGKPTDLSRALAFLHKEFVRSYYWCAPPITEWRKCDGL